MIELNHVIENYSTIFVDLDNTLFNYTLAHSEALELVLKKYNFTIEDYKESQKKLKLRELSTNHHKKEAYFKILCESHNRKISDVLDMYELYTSRFNEIILPDESMFNLLSYAKKQNKTIIGITNYYIIPQLKKLKSTGYIDLIDFLITSEEFEAEKPNKKLLNRALELSNYPDLKDIIMIGDSTVDDMMEFGIKYYPYNCSKLLISISGKSGAGKSTITKAIQEVFNATVIEADGYHKYQRGHKMWESLTHYNPKANNLVQLGLDIKYIYQNISDIYIPTYNHSSGEFSTPDKLNSNSLDVVIIEGLHTLYNEVTGEYVKIKIYLDSDLADTQKIDRDVKLRNKDIISVKDSINKRENDYNKYISIQKKYSNFIITVKDSRFTIEISKDLKTLNTFYSGEYKDLIETLKSIMMEFKENRYKKENNA